MERSWYLKVTPQDIAPYAILVGDPARVRRFQRRLAGAAVIGREREFTTLTGRFETTPVSVVSTGIGAPASAIVLEELAALGVRTVVRAGTMMAVTAPVGTLVLAVAACRFESTSRTYLPPEVPAAADPDLFAAFREVLDLAGVGYTPGLVATCDGFYTQMMPPPSRRGEVGLLDDFVRWRVAAADMETSAVYAIARALGMRAISLCAMTVDGRTQSLLNADTRDRLEQELVDIALQGVHAFAERERTHERT